MANEFKVGDVVSWSIRDRGKKFGLVTQSFVDGRCNVTEKDGPAGKWEIDAEQMTLGYRASAEALAALPKANTAWIEQQETSGCFIYWLGEYDGAQSVCSWDGIVSYDGMGHRGWVEAIAMGVASPLSAKRWLERQASETTGKSEVIAYPTGRPGEFVAATPSRPGDVVRIAGREEAVAAYGEGGPGTSENLWVEPDVNEATGADLDAIAALHSVDRRTSGRVHELASAMLEAGGITREQALVFAAARVEREMAAEAVERKRADDPYAEHRQKEERFAARGGEYDTSGRSLYNDNWAKVRRENEALFGRVPVSFSADLEPARKTDRPPQGNWRADSGPDWED